MVEAKGLMRYPPRLLPHPLPTSPITKFTGNNRRWKARSRVNAEGEAFNVRMWQVRQSLIPTCALIWLVVAVVAKHVMILTFCYSPGQSLSRIEINAVGYHFCPLRPNFFLHG